MSAVADVAFGKAVGQSLKARFEVRTRLFSSIVAALKGRRDLRIADSGDDPGRGGAVRTHAGATDGACARAAGALSLFTKMRQR